MSDVLTATRVTPTQFGRLLVFVAGKGYPVTVLDELPAGPVVVVDPDVTVFLDPETVAVVVDPVYTSRVGSRLLAAA